MSCHKMTKQKDKRREKISVATEIDRLEERRARCQDNLERAEFRSRKEKLSEKERQDLEDEMAIMTERVQKLVIYGASALIGSPVVQRLISTVNVWERRGEERRGEERRGEEHQT
ncbi:hypothetical protein INR49_029926, partial [Caranx melampygus]